MAFNPSEHFIQLPKRRKNQKTGQWETINADYLEVKWRVVWFREEKPNWGIETEAVTITDQQAIFRCTIKDDSGRIIATGYGSETPKDFGDYIEKAETKSIGRALAYLGYGTQFAPELDEGDRIADAPIDRPTQQGKPKDTISTEQAKFLFKLAEGDQDIVKDVLRTFGYKNTTDIKKSEYNQICKVVQEAVKNKEPELPWEGAEKNETV